MNTIKNFFLLLLLNHMVHGVESFSDHNTVKSLPDPIVLEAASMVDGVFVTWKTLVETIHPFMQHLYERVFGSIRPNGVKGFYEYNGSFHTLKELVILGEIDTSSEFNDIFHKAKTELIKLGNEFFSGADKAKPMIVQLIKEFCALRNRSDSLLLQWASAKHGYENDIFESKIKNVAHLDLFCVELLTFLQDFVYSCSKARQQLHAQLEKWHLLKDLLSDMIQNGSIVFQGNERDAFLHYLKHNAIANINLSDLNAAWIYRQYKVFNEKRK